MTSPFRVGWCPGALRPMAAGDGLIVRVKPHGATLTLDQAEAIAALAIRYGNALLDLTGRANLQLRGVRDDTLDALIAGLREAELLDDTPEAEAVRNVVSSPLAGLDPDAASDIRPIVAALEMRLAEDAELHRLPAKWSFVVDDGGRFPLTEVPADVRFEAVAGGVHVGLANDPARAVCWPGEVAGVAAALCREALHPQPARMAEAIAARGATNVFAAAGLSPLVRADTAGRAARRANPIGTLGLGHQVAWGVGAPFGSLNAVELAALVDAARVCGASEIRLTPWRTIFFTGLNGASAAALADAARDHGFIVKSSDPRLAVAACTGAPACHRATTPVRAHAAALASDLLPDPNRMAVHLSGCAKGCAHPAAAPWTLVGRDGFYDLVRDGRPGDPPIAHSLSFQDAASWISRNGNLGRP